MDERCQPSCTKSEPTPRASLALFVFLAAVTAGAISCDGCRSISDRDDSTQTAQVDLGAVKISLVPQAGKPVDVLIRWIPILPSEDWVPAIAALVNGALVGCRPPDRSIDVRFWVRDRVVHVPPKAADDPQDMACLYKSIAGQTLSIAGLQSEHEVLIRIARSSAKP